MSQRIIVPPIKCQGIKTKLVPLIRNLLPETLEGKWIEPFMGSGVVAFNIQPRQALLADANPHLINFYQAISDGTITHYSTREHLYREGTLLLKSEGEHYYLVRDRFNQHGDPLDFLFLNRSCFNGLMRFNKKREFNVPFCHKPNRFMKSYVTKISNQVRTVSEIINLNRFEFRCQDFYNTIQDTTEKDTIYCDPPYIGRHTDYYNGWGEREEEALANILSVTPNKFILSTWHSNKYRYNDHIDRYWSQYFINLREHYYHVGAKEDNRNSIIEALITNYKPPGDKAKQDIYQSSLLET